MIMIVMRTIITIIMIMTIVIIMILIVMMIATTMSRASAATSLMRGLRHGGKHRCTRGGTLTSLDTRENSVRCGRLCLSSAFCFGCLRCSALAKSVPHLQLSASRMTISASRKKVNIPDSVWHYTCLAQVFFNCGKSCSKSWWSLTRRKMHKTDEAVLDKWR